MNDDYLQRMREYGEELRKDPVRLKAFMRKVMGPSRRTLVGEERKKILTLLRLLEPISSSNNQRTWTDEYQHGGKIYHATYGDLGNEMPIIEVFEEENGSTT